MTIDYQTARELILEANRGYNIMLAEGDWSAVAVMRKRIQSSDYTFSDAALFAVSECRNPSPVSDITDLRCLIGKTKIPSGMTVKQYFVAVFQSVFSIGADLGLGNCCW
jgi:hypothetical protein